MLEQTKSIIISPFASPLRNGGENAKNFPFWNETVKLLNDNNWLTIQIGRNGEREILDIDFFFKDLPLKRLKEMAQKETCWVSPDNFMPHLMNTIGKIGIVLFSKSSPSIFGYPQNINLLKDKKYLRPDQFRWWEDCEFNADAFVSPETILEAAESLAAKNTK